MNNHFRQFYNMQMPTERIAVELIKASLGSEWADKSNTKRRDILLAAHLCLALNGCGETTAAIEQWIDTGNFDVPAEVRLALLRR